MDALIHIRSKTTSEICTLLSLLRNKILKDENMFQSWTEVSDVNDYGAYEMEVSPEPLTNWKENKNRIKREPEKEFKMPRNTIPVFESEARPPTVSKKIFRQWIIGALVEKGFGSYAATLADEIISFGNETNIFHDQIKES